MSWLTKDLTLDILSITIHGLVKIHDAINDTQPTPPKPHSQNDWPATTTVDQPPATQADNQPAQQDIPSLPQIQEKLRTIAQTEGTDWIQNTLFPALGITNLTSLDQSDYPRAWEMITTHTDQTHKAA